ncbi:MAG TPA: hypothetical protein VJP88_05840 [Caulobacteraceae bacterium]|nr:hypothetical protein [Caulobacteraceae bacterium]
MILLGLDPSSTLFGWCCGSGRGAVPDCGAWQMPDHDGDFGLMLAALEDYLNTAFARFGFEAVAYEKPLLVPKRFINKAGQRISVGGDNLPKLRRLYPLGAFTEWWCYRREIPVYEVTVQEVKAEVTGNHLAEKGDLVSVAQRCGLKLPPSKAQGIEDAADAFGAWLLLLRHCDSDASRKWDALIWSGRGSLL